MSTDAYEAWRKWFAESGAAAAWSEFIGPCAHGRDPYTRCDVCGELEPGEAKALAEKASPGCWEKPDARASG